MDTFAPKNIKEPSTAATSAEEQLSEVFGSYKAEWLRERVFDYFTAPYYLPELLTARPCVLLGGRGTGKTTVLKGLSYEGQFAITKHNAATISDWPYYGLYLRVNTNRVAAFNGPELDLRDWTRLFGHYMNLVLCNQTVAFLLWYQRFAAAEIELNAQLLSHVAESLHLRPVSSILELADQLRSSRLEFEAYINNVVDGPRPLISMQGAPLDALFEALGESKQFSGKLFFFLLDEYENYEDYQQKVVNTLIKHSGSLYTFKIGVKELGWRVRSTLNENEQLISPSDYVRIKIAERLNGDAFKQFARDVCNSRLATIHVEGQRVVADIGALLLGLTEEEEAEKLGIESLIADFRNELVNAQPETSPLLQLTALQLFLLLSWPDSQKKSTSEIAAGFLANQKEWQTRFGNYTHALLFAIKKRKRGIRKYYAGWDVFTQLAANNIRYLIELVDQSLLRHLKEGRSLSDAVDTETQTKAAQSVGRKNVSELEGLSVDGAQLTKLVLGLGRIFQVMASQPFGHAPEVNEFRINEQDDAFGVAEIPDEIDGLVKSGVMHLALIRFPANKLAEEGETRDYDYTIHPIFSPFFEFSYRRKRRMVISASDLLALVREPQQAIPRILSRQNRSADEELPEQVQLFRGYYGQRS